MRVLHVAAEAYPLVKTGGLADVVAALPPAQAQAGADVRLLLPGLPAVRGAVQALKPVLHIGAAFGALRVQLWLGRMPDTGLPVYVLDAPHLYQRAGGPYQAEHGAVWPDNLQRFALLGWVAAHLASGDADPGWVPQVLHAHDWHAAMACAYLADHWPTAATTVFTVHNLAYQGLFPAADFHLLGLGARHMAPGGIEFHGQLSFMKAGLVYADKVSTVSPGYAREVTTAEYGCGLDGVLRHRAHDVVGILNGIDTSLWNPATDAALAQRYSGPDPAAKCACRQALQQAMGLAQDSRPLLVAVVSRLTAQKGLDLVLQALPGLLADGVQLAVQGTGEPALEAAFRQAALAHPGQVAVHIGYDEDRAHRLIAGADVIAVPSRFEPCGLTQLYGLRYGTPPVVRRVGGLADTVDDGRSGFVFDEAQPEALARALRRASAMKARAPAWQALQQAGMSQDLSWQRPAAQYLDLYRQAGEARLRRPTGTAGVAGASSR